MNPTRPPIPPYPGRAYSNEAIPNPLYGMHVNAAGAYGAGPSSQRVHPRSNSSPTSFYPPHLAQHSRTPQPPPLLPKPASLASAPPPSLMPGSGVRSRTEVFSSLESSLFFQSSATPLASPSISPTNTTSHPYAQNTASSLRPALPPKPRLQTDTSVAPFSGRTAPKVPPKHFTTSGKPIAPTAIPESPASPDNDELVAHALELSLQDSGPVRHSDLEDDILARVLAESLASINSSTAHDRRACPDTSSPRQLETNSNAEPLSASSSSPSSSSPSFVETPATSAYSHSAEVDYADRNKMRRISASIGLEELAKQEQELIRAGDESRRKQLEMDEEFARSIARLEVNNTSTSSTHRPVSAGISSGALFAPSFDAVSGHPLYGAALNAGRPSSFHVASSSQQNLSSLHDSISPPPIVSDSRSLSARCTPSLGRAYGSYSAGVPHDHITPSFDKLGRSVSAQAAIPLVTEGAACSSSIAANRPSISPNDTRPSAVIPVQARLDSDSPEGSPSAPKGRPKLGLEGLKRALSAGQSIGPGPPLEEVEENEVTGDGLSPIMSPTSIEEPDEWRMVSNIPPSSAPIVEEELLLGVSFGFNAPSMSPIHSPMQGPIPNIITLPYGKCPPLHMQAPSWKHLLKLLTRLSDSRIEPTVEALAGTKADLKLRTVIQFMKVHHSSEDWRTIVYLTIDIPIPPSTPNIFKYTNGDVTTFPYSYTTSPLPALLRAGAGDSNLSRCFTVPSTASTPYPTLPMTLPDFAMYLHAVLEGSRRAVNDSSGGLRKLAKMVDSFYPASADAFEGIGPEFNGPDKRGMGGFFRRALGRGNKDSQSQRGGNAERFEFITPFRIDEYR